MCISLCVELHFMQIGDLISTDYMVIDLFVFISILNSIDFETKI